MGRRSSVFGLDAVTPGVRLRAYGVRVGRPKHSKTGPTFARVYFPDLVDDVALHFGSITQDLARAVSRLEDEAVVAFFGSEEAVRAFVAGGGRFNLKTETSDSTEKIKGRYSICYRTKVEIL